MSYSGPPSTTPPPPDWRPRVFREPASPRPLPPQDQSALTAAEQAARRFTLAVGAAAAAVALVVLVVLAASGW